MENYQINQKEKGFHRDRSIIYTIQDYRALDTDQVKALFFDKMKYGQRKAQERLLKLHQRDKLNRWDKEKPFLYYLGEKPGMTEHLINLNWVRIWLIKSCRSWEKLHGFLYEQDYGILRADGFAAVKNIATGEFRFYFIEMDQGTNEFDKIKKYCSLYEKEGYLDRWWVRLADRFPKILIVTVSLARAERINRLIKKENSPGLEFKVMLISEIKEVCNGVGMGQSAVN